MFVSCSVTCCICSVFSLYRHENASGFYGVAAYFFAKFLSDLIPMRLIPMFVFCVIIYFMTGK